MNTRMNLYQPPKKKKWPWIVAALVALLILGSAIWAQQTGYLSALTADTSPVESQQVVPPKSQPEEVKEPQQQEPEKEPEPAPEPEIDRSGAKGYEGNETLPQEPTVVKGILMASKQYPLPADYAPGESEEARAAFEEMAAAARVDGFELVAFSTFRSFERQQELYKRYVKNDGQEAADRYSARPGYSEHQTGLAFDIGEQNSEEHFARESFGETEAGKWVASNAHEFGFIMRYPNGKEKITGYMYEPWHFRYLGKELAKELNESGLTVEEYIEQ